MQIGELAKRASVNIQTIRYYERRGVLLPSTVKVSGYRQYEESDLKRLLFIRQTQELGFTLEEIGEFLKLDATGNATCGKIRIKADEKLSDIREKIELLKRIERALVGLVKTCKTNPKAKSCHFLERIN